MAEAQIPSAASLGFLHDVIRQTFGWEGYHLHRFHDQLGASLHDAFVIESTTRLLKILSDFGAADVDWGTTPWRGDEAAASLLFAGISPAQPGS